jgi:hypothetical protein
MIVELLSPNNYISFNIKLAKSIGVINAIYISELINVNEKALRKGKISNNYFTINREYIESRTTFDANTQRIIEDKLIKAGVLVKSDALQNTFSINYSLLANLVHVEDSDLLMSVETPIVKKRSTARKSSKANKDSTTQFLKSCITTTDNEIRDAYYLWIDYVLQKGTHMTDLFIKDAQTQLEHYAKGDKSIMIDVLTIGAKYAYRDLKYAISIYESEKKCTPLASGRMSCGISNQKF